MRPADRDETARTLVVMATTYPRWPDDSVPNFVAQFVGDVADRFRAVQVVVPHWAGAKRVDRTGPRVTVRRFRYAVPYRLERLGYGQSRARLSAVLTIAPFLISEAFATYRAVVGNRPALINAHWLIPQGFVAVALAKVLRCPVVVSVHGGDVYTLDGRAMRAVKRFVLKRAAAVIVNSTATEAVCRELYDRHYDVAPMGVDVDAFAGRLTHHSDRPAGRLELLFVGRMVADKGVTYLLEAMRLLRDSGSTAHLTMVGDGAARAEVEAFVADNALADTVTVTGWVSHDQLAPCYAAADVFVGPSIQSDSGWQEAFGVVFAEASAMGLPVIATRTGGIADVVVDGTTGLLVQQRDAEAIADAVRRLEADPQLRARMGRAGQRYVVENFSTQATAERYLAVFRTVG